MVKNYLYILLPLLCFLFNNNPTFAFSAPIPSQEMAAPQDEYEPSEFPGGQKAFEKWLKKYVHYPDQEREAGIEETIVVQFTITPEGDIKYPHIQKGENDNLMDAALEAMKKMPKWKPARINGQPIESQAAIEIEFYIQEQMAPPVLNKLNRRNL